MSTDASAVEVDETLGLTCPFPLVASQPVDLRIQADLLDRIRPGYPTGSSRLDLTLSLLSSDISTGFRLVGATQFQAKGEISVREISNRFALPMSLSADFKSVEIGPDTQLIVTPGTSELSSRTYLDPEVGVIDIVVDDLQLSGKVYRADGSLAPDPVGEFESDCTLVDGAQLLHSFEVLYYETGGLEILTETLDFGEAGIGETVTDSVMVTGAGFDGGSLDSIEIVGTGADAFTYVTDCGSFVPIDSPCTIDITFAPYDNGDYTAELIIKGEGNPDPVALTGRAFTVEFNPVSLAVDGVVNLIGPKVASEISGALEIPSLGSDGGEGSIELSLQSFAKTWLFGFIPVRAELGLFKPGTNERVLDLSVALDSDGSADLTTAADVVVTGAKVRFLGSTFALTVPETCRTLEPVAISLSDDQVGTNLIGSFAGEFSIGTLGDCGLISSDLLAGEANTLLLETALP